MIAAANGSGGCDDESGRDPIAKPADSMGGQLGGRAPNIELNDRRVQLEAKRILGLIEAGAIASDDLKRLAEKIKARTSKNEGRCSNRDLAALAKLQIAIATAANDKAAAITNININAPQQVQVIYVDDWYGSKAASIAATNGPPIAGPHVG
jgi:ribosomal protein S16